MEVRTPHATYAIVSAVLLLFDLLTWPGDRRPAAVSAERGLIGSPPNGEVSSRLFPNRTAMAKYLVRMYSALDWIGL
jgi:hypothetical protein